jgi:hypothetical protein
MWKWLGMVRSLIRRLGVGIPEEVAMSQHRSEFRFRESAQNALGFLIKDYGFTCVKACDLRVRYESNKVYIEMIHGLHDCEVYISFGRLTTQEAFSFTLFLKLVNPNLEKSLGDRMVNTPETVMATVNSLAQVLQSEGQGIIKGDDKVFVRMKDVRWWDFFPEALG